MIKVEGNILLEEGDSSDDEYASDDDVTVVIKSEASTIPRGGGDDSDDDDEELEVFDGREVAKKSAIIKKSKPTSSEPTFSLIDAMANSVASIEKTQVNNASGASKNNDLAIEKEDIFGISYVPYKKKTAEYVLPSMPAIEDEDVFIRELNQEAVASKPVDDDNEFDFDANDNDDALQAALDRAALKASSEPVLHVSNDDSEVSTIVDNSSEMEEKFSVRESAQEAFNELKNIYTSGLGDVEVRLLSSESSATTIASDGVSKGFKTSVNKNVATEVIEEGDEEAELENEIREVEEIELIQTNQQLLAQVWDTLETPANLSKNSASHEDVPTRFITYDEALADLQSTNLSVYEEVIVTREDKSGGGVWSLMRSSTSLTFPGCEEALKLPFLLAQVDYDPSNARHLNCLQKIFRVLVFSNDKAKFACPPVGPHWEKIGFQGVNPITDLNRSMKMFAVLQMLYLVDSDLAFVRALHYMSESAMRVTVGKDMSWPFMCVSVMFTKEAIQALRRGVLNKKCNKSQNILIVLHNFHQACFYDFAKRIKAQPNLHHAEHLKNLRDLCQSNPIQLYNTYRLAVKNRKSASDDLLGNDVTTSISNVSKAEASATFDDLDNAAVDSDGAQRAPESSGFFSSIGLAGRASKFKA